MDGYSVLFRPVEIYLRLRKTEPAYISTRQNSNSNLAIPAGVAGILILQDIVLLLKESIDPVSGNAPDLTDLQIDHLASDIIITENRNITSIKNTSCCFISFHPVWHKVLPGNIEKTATQCYNNIVEIRFCESGGRASFRKRSRRGFAAPAGSGKRYFLCMEERT